MAKRTNNTRDEHGVWDIGGGGVEFGDSIDQTIRQEIRQEYCTEVLEYEFLGYRDMHRIHQGVPTHWIALDFKVLITPALVKNGEEDKFDDVKFFKLDCLPAPVHSQFPVFLDLYKKRLQ